MIDTVFAGPYKESRGSGQNMSSIGERARRRREALGITQKYVASQLNVSPNTYSNYENDVRKIDAEMVRELAKILKTTTSYLLGESDDPEETKFEAAMRFGDMEIKLLKSFNLSEEQIKNLTDEQIREIQAFIEFQMSRHRNRS